MSLRSSIFALLLSAWLISFSSNPKREFRSVWIATVNNDWPTTAAVGTSADAQDAQKKELTDLLDAFEYANLTSACLQVRSMGDALYPSRYAPWSSFVSGTRGTSPGYDPLAFFVEEAHKRGLEAYVWLNPYRWSNGTTWSTAMDKEWLSSGMIISGDNGSYKTFNPALAETRQMIVNVVTEILNNYAIDGVIFDDYFYPSGGTSEGSDAPDYDDYLAAGTSLSIGDWRRRNVNDLVADVYNAIKKLRPDVRFGISPAGVSSESADKYGLDSPSSYGVTASDWQYAQIYSDPLTWLYEGTIDFISPQCYWETTHATAPYEPLTKWWSYVSKVFNRHYYSSQRTYCIDATELEKQISLNRIYVENNACGTIHWKSYGLYGEGGPNHVYNLQKNLYSTQCLIPTLSWKSGLEYPAVSDLSYEAGTLSWSRITNGDAIIRYTIYAIPMPIDKDQIAASDGDGIAGDYLVRTVYGNSYTLPEELQRNYWYAVCPFDGYGKEHEPAYVNYPTGVSDVPELLSPVNNDTAPWVAVFSWSDLGSASYILEISSDEDFSTILYTSDIVWTNSITIDLGEFDQSTQYHWRVKASQSGKTESVSPIGSFMTAEKSPAPSTSLLAPEDNASIHSDFTFQWRKTDCDKYCIEISKDENFTSIKQSHTVTDTILDIEASSLGRGTFFWRVTTMGSKYTPSQSGVYRFTIESDTPGLIESGYSIMKDYSSYSPDDKVAIRSLWFRSVNSDYDNITFEKNGSYNRSFCATNECVFMAGRTENSETADIYLRKFDKFTGEIIETLTLSENGKVGFYPCNSVVKDSKDNICISNLTINATDYPLLLWLVDTESGELQQKARVTPSVSPTARIDHVAVSGDVADGNFTLYAAIKDSPYVIKWIYENDELKSERYCSLQAFYPSASNLGIAPRVIPVDDESFFINGGSTYLTRYGWTTYSQILDSFGSNSLLEPISLAANGGTFFALGDNSYIVYPYSDYTSGYTFNLVRSNRNMDFSSMELLWNLPAMNIGTVNSTTLQSDADYIALDDGRVIIYLFVPGCGLCAYELSELEANSVDTISSETIKIIVAGSNISFNCEVDSAVIFDILGTPVQRLTNTSSYELNISPGLYVVKAQTSDQIITQKILIN